MVAISAASSFAGLTLDPGGEKEAVLTWKANVKTTFIFEMVGYFFRVDGMHVHKRRITAQQKQQSTN